MSSRKRKNRDHQRTYYEPPSHDKDVVPDPALIIQAHEGDVVRGPQARLAALSLEVGPGHVGSALIKWGAHDDPTYFRREQSPSDIERDEDQRESIWVDRYDARLLLDDLPEPSLSAQVRSHSPSGWSDLPSDTEDTFFFSPDEAEDYRREKRRRLIDQSREERLRALREEEGPEEEEDADTWGGSDEEPDDAQVTVMHKTAQHILSSLNPAQLEIRILANYGGDKRFAFLRGRWSRAWRTLKGKVRVEIEEKKEQEKNTSGNVSLGGLAAYGDSDDESEGHSDAAGSNLEPSQEPEPPSDETLKEARRARAREWSARRRTVQAAEEQNA
ncbi:hypothetical protein SERLA73DRAFT_161591 [Serpula lacrymans var. lacrymans S7.3]|uniref:Uncharacterized protein n=2 Tax=Serpula lacrymans var. lacrymans TaxID=341189 RepID=F8Q380_SERL3|nr:uncharacterized protein SERLADRAFT_409623 [Serpula lacrymans var. lacrymans S7.9]EGN97641.1 hypothetical protein SERLA73DRAFT_161591 [Serpula lacrymans var. lacrymans S7.3]EGO23235.1 hypothetical protein SERLADRAFT_409623 [Serpula lacrymans var. lacrymans S7.9]